MSLSNYATRKKRACLVVTQRHPSALLEHSSLVSEGAGAVRCTYLVRACVSVSALKSIINIPAIIPPCNQVRHNVPQSPPVDEFPQVLINRLPIGLEIQRRTFAVIRGKHGEGPLNTHDLLQQVS